MAEKRGLPIARDELREAARRWALWQNAPSGRSARQFIDDLSSRLGR
jgi:predicted AAA+ superfamily ATPase